MYHIYNDIKRSNRPPLNPEALPTDVGRSAQSEGTQAFEETAEVIAHEWVDAQQAIDPLATGLRSNDQEIELAERGQLRYQPSEVSLRSQAHQPPSLGAGDYEHSSQPQSVVSQLMSVSHPIHSDSLSLTEETGNDQQAPSILINAKQVLQSLKREIENDPSLKSGHAIGSGSIYSGLTTNQINTLKQITTGAAATAGLAFIPLLSASLSYIFNRPNDEQDIDVQRGLIFAAYGSFVSAGIAAISRYALNGISPIDPIRENDTQTVHRQVVIKPLEKYFIALQKTVKNFSELSNNKVANAEIIHTFDELMKKSSGFRRDILDMVKVSDGNINNKLDYIRNSISKTLDDMAKNSRKPLDYSGAIKVNEIIPNLWGLIKILDDANGGLKSNSDSSSPEYRLFENLIKGLYSGANFCSAGYTGQILQRFSDVALAILDLDKIEEVVGVDNPFSTGKDFVDYYPSFGEDTMAEILSEPEVYKQLKELYIQTYKNETLIHELIGQEAIQQKEVYKHNAVELIKSFFRDKINLELSDKHPQILEKSPGFGDLIFSYYEAELPILMDNVVATNKLYEKFETPECLGRARFDSSRTVSSVLSFS